MDLIQKKSILKPDILDFNTPTEIIPNLWLANIKTSQDTDFLKEKRIKVIINCTKNIPFANYDCEKFRIPVDDNLELSEIVNLYKSLWNATDLIASRIIRGESVLVHCHAGAQRSAAVICAFVMRFSKMKLNDCIVFIKTKRPVAFTFSVNFQKALEQYSRDLGI
jgi:protein-tyrosine phosphatase